MPRWVHPALLQCLAILLLTGCAASAPQQESLDYLTRAVTQSIGKVQVSAGVLSPLETESSLSVPLHEKDIQPIWIEIDNREDKEFVLMLLSIDPDYFAPSEVAWKFRGMKKIGDEDIFDFFFEQHIPILISPQKKASGFVYTNLDPGPRLLPSSCWASVTSGRLISPSWFPALRQTSCWWTSMSSTSPMKSLIWNWRSSGITSRICHAV
jgi:hypothetical protein